MMDNKPRMYYTTTGWGKYATTVCVRGLLGCLSAACLSVWLSGCITPVQLGGDQDDLSYVLHSGGETETGLVDAGSSLIDDQMPPPVTAASRLPSDVPYLSQGLRVEGVLQHALDHHPRLRARQHEVEIARAGLITAGLLPNPQLVMDAESPVHESDPTDLTTRVMFTIPTGGKRRLGEAVACAGITRAQFALGLETETVLVEAADAAMEVLYLQELLSLRGQLSQLAAKGARMQQAYFQMAQSTSADVVEADFDAADIELERLETIGELDVARLRLARAMGLASDVLPWMAGKHVVTPIPDVPLETILAAARAGRPELAEARATVTQGKRQLALACAQAKPDLEMGPRYQAAIGKADDQIGARLSLDLPVFDRNQGGISESDAQLRVSRALLDDSKLNTINDVAAVYVQLLSVRSRLQYYDAHVMPLIDKTEASILSDPQQQQQAIGANQVSDLLQEFAKMRVSHLELRYLYNKLLVRLELFLGCRLDDLQQQWPSHSPSPSPLASVELLSPGGAAAPQ